MYVSDSKIGDTKKSTFTSIFKFLCIFKFEMSYLFYTRGNVIVSGSTAQSFHSHKSVQETFDKFTQICAIRTEKVVSQHA